MQHPKTGRPTFDPATGRAWHILPGEDGQADYLAAGARGADLSRLPARPGTGEALPAGSFPLSAEWEITPRRARGWYLHQFQGFRGESDLMRRLGDLSHSELALLLWDLSCYEGLVQRWERGLGHRPPPLDEYLRADREHWGAMAEMLRELGWWEAEDG